MSRRVYQGKAWPRLSKMLVTFGTTATMSTPTSKPPMMTINTG